MSEHEAEPPTLKGVCAAVGCGEGPVKTLAERGWVTIDRPAGKGPATVSLALAGEAVTDALVTLRGAQRHRAVLEALLRAGRYGLDRLGVCGDGGEPGYPA